MSHPDDQAGSILRDRSGIWWLAVLLWTVLIVGVLLTLTAGVGPAAAQTDTSEDDGPFGFFGDEDANSTDDEGMLETADRGLAWVDAALSAGWERAQFAFASSLPDGVADEVPGVAAVDGAETDLDETATFVEDRSGTFVGYANTHVNDSTNKTLFNVFKVVAEDEAAVDGEGDPAVRYVVLSVNNSTGNYTSVSVVETTNRSVDYTVTLQPLATHNLPETSERVYDQYVEPGREPDRPLKRRLIAQYGPEIDVVQGAAGPDPTTEDDGA